MMPRILVIDDDAAIAELVAVNLEMAGYEVTQAEDGIKGQALAIQLLPDLIMLDLMLPKVDGFTVCQRLRRDERTADIPVLMLTALSQTQDKVEGFNAGADDYLTKPFELEELLARVRALVRRGHEVKDPIIRVFDLEIDTAARSVKRAGQSIHLTPREYGLLEFLAFHRGRVVTRTMIWEHLYDEHDESTSNVVDVYIRYLRNKIDKGFDPPLILTRWGEGYQLRSEDGA